MNMESLESETLMAIGYDDAREILQLEFQSYAIYQYFGVPVSEYETFVAAPSKVSSLATTCPL